MFKDYPDHIIAKFTSSLHACIEEIAAETGSPPSISDIQELILWSIKGSEEVLFKDGVAGSLDKVILKTLKRARRVRPGDLVRIQFNSKYHALAVFITSNQFGDAFGVFLGRRTAANPNPRACVPFRVFYTGREHVANGRWPIIGNRPELLGLFPNEPEVFRPKADYEGEDEYLDAGEFGFAENPQGIWRQIEAGESICSEILRPDFSPVFLEEQLEAYLNKILV